MPHSMIVRVAWGLSVFLVLACVAFAWAANQRERHYEQLIAQAAQEAEAARAAAPAGGAAAPPASTDPAAAAAAAQAAFGKRCAKCHEPAEMAEWAQTLQSGGGEAAAFEFLQKHKKAPEAESRVLAAWFAGGGTVE